MPCLNQTQLASTCSPINLECACDVVLSSPLMSGCAFQKCGIGGALCEFSTPQIQRRTFATADHALHAATANGTATACHVPMRDKGAALYVTTTALCVIALSSILLRLLGAPTSQRKWTQVADDWYMLLNAVSAPETYSRPVRPLTELPGFARWHDGRHHTSCVHSIYFSFCSLE